MPAKREGTIIVWKLCDDGRHFNGINLDVVAVGELDGRHAGNVEGASGRNNKRHYRDEK